MIFVVGATGVVGGMITRQLRAQGKDVRVLLRRNSPFAAMATQGLATSAQSLIDAGAQPAYGDLKDRRSLDEAMQDVETVITTANSFARGGADSVETVDRTGNQQLVAAAKAAGVEHFVFVSTLGADVASPMPFMQAKGEAEAALRGSGMDYTILSPTPFMEVWINLVVGTPVRTGQPVTLVGEGRRRHAFISNRDVAAFAVAAVDRPEARNQALMLGGPNAYSWRDIVAAFERILGRSIQTRFVPLGAPAPGLPETALPLLGAMETFDTDFDTSEHARAYGVRQVTLDEFVQTTYVT
jgi:NADH dehydrogenase